MATVGPSAPFGCCKSLLNLVAERGGRAAHGEVGVPGGRVQGGGGDTSCRGAGSPGGAVFPHLVSKLGAGAGLGDLGRTHPWAPSGFWARGWAPVSVSLLPTWEPGAALVSKTKACLQDPRSSEEPISAADFDVLLSN